MPQAPAPPAPVQEQDLTRTYVLVVIVEAIVLAGLYWLGRYFG